MLNVSDDYIREYLACIVDTSLSGRRVVRKLTAIAKGTWTPKLTYQRHENEEQVIHASFHILIMANIET